MAKLDARKRDTLPDSAFAYVDSRGKRRLPIHDESHVRNALSRFNQVRFEDDAAREKARKRLLTAAKRHGIVPIGFMTGQIESERTHAVAGRLVIELGRGGAPGALEERLRSVLRDPTLAVLHWSQSAGAYLDARGKPIPLPAESDARAVTYLEREGRPMTALVHDPAVLGDPRLAETVLAAVRFVIDKDRGYGHVEATATTAAALPAGFVTLLMSDIEGSTALLRRLGDRYRDLLNDVRDIQRAAVSRARGREIDFRADEFFAVFERAADAVKAAVTMQRAMRERDWPEGLDVRVRIGIHSGQPTLTDAGYIGLAVHAAARVCSAAHGGQILVSGVTRDAVERPDGVRFRDLGRHRLQGLADREALYQILAKGLRASFPSPRTKGRPRAKVRSSAKGRPRAKGR